MNLRELAAALVRRWYLSLLALIISLGLGLFAFSQIGPTYAASSTLVPMPPQSVINSARADQSYAPNNPLLYLGTLSNARDVLVSSLGSTQVQSQLQSRAPGASVSVAADATSGSPMIVVTSEAKTKSAALTGVRSMGGLADTTLRSVQDSLNVTSANRVTLYTLTQDKRAKTQRKKQLEYTILAFVLSMLSVLLVIALVDNLGRRLSAQRDNRLDKLNDDNSAAAPHQQDIDRNDNATNRLREERVGENAQ